MGQRMFVAVVPPDEVVEHLEEFLEPRRDQGMPWIHPEQWHVTLAFMESVGAAAEPELEERLAEAAAKRRPMTLRLCGSGTFPDPVAARVIWLGLQGRGHEGGSPADDLNELHRLAVNVRAAASTSGAPVDGKPFHPHLSLARLKRPVEATRWLRVLDTYVGPAWEVDEVELVASHLHEGPGRRPRHRTTGCYRLGARPSARS
ncbi:MAG: RNA 2',3'-cyclic phosphodiesterase [Actinomycetota bacterium]|nr:RNA 2',3'-cyclic phosphodiesterase [Actinomycetota bacterium]